MRNKNQDCEPNIAVFSQLNIYIVDQQVLDSFLGNDSLMDHYNKWVDAEIYSNQYILNALKSKMQSIDFNQSYYLMKTYGQLADLRFQQNAFYPLSYDQIVKLRHVAKEKLDSRKGRKYVFAKHVQKLDKLLARYDDHKLDGKALLISTW